MLKKLLNYCLVIILTGCSVIVIAAASLYYFINTPAGVRALVHYGLLQSGQHASVTIGTYEGTLVEGLTFKNVQIRNWPVLGPSAIFRIQRVDVRVVPWGKNNIQVNIFNGKLSLKDCDDILFNGTFINGAFHINAYSRGLDVAVIMSPFLAADVMKNLTGSISNVELALDGSIQSPRIRGHFYIDRIQYKETAVREGLARYDLTFPADKAERAMIGPLTIENGSVNVEHSIVELQQSQALFKGPVDNPSLSIFGTTEADVYTIDIKVLGTLQKPQLQVSSDPYLPEDMAFMALGWGSWAVADYSTFKQSGDQRVGLKKEVINDVKLGFELEQKPSRLGQQQSTYSQKLAGELAITDRFSFNVAESLSNSRDTNQTNSNSPNTDDTRRQGESEFYLKYKNTF